MATADPPSHGRSDRFAIVPEIVLLDRRLKDVDVRVYATLARFGDESYPSLATIARKLGKGETTVRDSLARLRDAGVIDIAPRYDSTGRQSSNGYRIIARAPLRDLGPSDNLDPPKCRTNEGAKPRTPLGTESRTQKRTTSERENPATGARDPDLDLAFGLARSTDPSSRAELDALLGQRPDLARLLAARELSGSHR